MRLQSALLLGSSIFSVALGKEAGPCCKACEAGKEKYYSVPSQKDPNPQCGETCITPSRYTFWKVFEPKLLKGDCASHGFTKYVSTETDGVWPLANTNDRYVHSGSTAQKDLCPEKLQAVYADMHDGDKKEVTIEGTTITIKPSGNKQTWVVRSELDRKSCSASIDFNVPGKPGPPPVNLTATFWYSVSEKGMKTEFEFTDPSGTLAAKTYPLNRWVELSGKEGKGWPCQTSLRAVYADMHDGDKKEIIIDGTELTIKPSGNNQTWVVKSHVDSKTCSAIINFNVPGKPGPPPVNLTASLLYTFSTAKKTEFEFTDPSGTLAAADFPLNHWVEISKAGMELVI